MIKKNCFTSLAFTLLFALFFITSCNDPVYTPKPRGFPKVNYPERGFQKLDVSYCDFTFEFPAYAKIIQDTQFFEEQPLHPCWFDIYMPAFDSRLHCSYIPVTENKSFDELRSDAFDMANWHNKKANYIEEAMVNNRYGTNGTVFEFDGPVASPYQFFLTDSTRQHFFRASLYFNTFARPDSLAPVYAFVKEDLEKMLETFQWE